MRGAQTEGFISIFHLLSGVDINGCPVARGQPVLPVGQPVAGYLVARLGNHFFNNGQPSLWPAIHGESPASVPG